MPLITTFDMLLKARENGCAVAAFNCENMEMIQAVVAAGEEMNAPVIIIIRDYIARGISKVNFATELRIAFTKAVRNYLAKEPDCFDPKKYGTAAREAVKQLAMNRITVCGCQNMA